MPRALLPARLAATVLALAALLASLGVVAPSLAPTAAAATPVPPVPAGLPTAVEAPADYVRQNSCSLVAQPGTLRLAELLRRTYPGITTGMTRVCSTAGSEHHDGRAIDWMTSVRSSSQRASAEAFLRWLLATDARGNRYANARRLGVMYLIWDNRILGLYNADAGWRPYRDCATRPARSDDSVCHRNHIHISLSWAGARGTTSYWTKRVAAPDHGPCRPADLNWARYYTGPRATPCAAYATVRAPAGASSVLRALVPYSGMDMRRGSRGNGVVALQRALRITADGVFGAQTEAAVKRFQTRKGIKATGRVGHTVWRALLAENGMPSGGTAGARRVDPTGPLALGPDQRPDEGDR